MKLLLFSVLTVVVGLINKGTSTPTVSSTLLQELETDRKDIMVVVGSLTTTKVLADINARRFIHSVAKTEAIVATLRAATDERHAPILDLIYEHKTGSDKSDVDSFYITDMISIKRADIALVMDLMNREDIEAIQDATPMRIESFGTPVILQDEVISTQAIEWGVTNINAPQCWAAGFSGAEMVVSTIDTGVRSTHSALKNNYRGDMNYGWFDPCTNTTTSHDTNGHGTHTMGTLVGQGGIGVAPNATWSSCLGCPNNVCPKDCLLKCLQWILCPTLADGTGQNCSMKPHVSSNSWGIATNDTSYQDSINALVAAGISVVAAGGNTGSSCQSIHSPGAYANVFAAGACDSNNTVASFSSRGPVLYSPPQGQKIYTVKPGCCAPGVSIRSAYNTSDTSYAIGSGTSMACPHYAGAIALLRQMNSSADSTLISSAFAKSARKDLSYTAVCLNGIADKSNPWPNNEYGCGNIDVYSAAKYINSSLVI